MRALSLFFLFFLISGCEILASKSGEFEAQITPSGLILENNLNETAYYFAVGRELAARINWAPGFSGNNYIRGGTSKMIPLDGIGQDENEREFLVYWWTTLDQQALQKEGAVSTIIVTLD